MTAAQPSPTAQSSTPPLPPHSKAEPAPALARETRPDDARNSSDARAADISRILGLLVPVSVMLADRPMPVEQILKLNVGTIVEFDVPFDSELILEVADRPVGRGLAVKVGENFGLRVTQIGNVETRINALRGCRAS